MNKIYLILLIISLSGCVATRKGPPRFKENNPPVCPDVIKATAKNLEDLGVDKAKVQAWRNEVLSLKAQPCNVCLKMNETFYIIKDENGDRRAAMKKLIQSVEASDPNTAPLTEKQTKQIGLSMTENNDKEYTALAGQYMSALDDLYAFLVGQVHLQAEETRNFILDKFYIPLIKQEEQTK